MVHENEGPGVLAPEGEGHSMTGGDLDPNDATDPNLDGDQMPPDVVVAGGHVQVTVKIGDHEINGGTRYRAWVEHKDKVMERLTGWQIVAMDGNMITFHVPQSVVAAALAERQAKVPKDERRYWGDKTDFCRCLEAVLSDIERGQKPRRKPREPRPGVLAMSQGVGFQRDPRPRMPMRQPLHMATGLDSIDVLVRMLENKAPTELIGFERRLRIVMNRIEVHLHSGGGSSLKTDLPKDWSPMIDLPLPPSAPQTVKRGCSKIQRSMLPLRLSAQVEELQQRLNDLMDSLQQGFLDPKALGTKSHHEGNPAHVAALLKTGLAIMGKESVDDQMEHWMCVPRPRLIQVYIDEFNRVMKNILDQSQAHANMNPPGPLAKYSNVEPSTYAVQASKERLGERILHCLNVMVVPIVDKSCTPWQVTKGVMSNPVGMPDDYLVRYLDMLYKNVNYSEREQSGAMLLGDAAEFEILRATLPKDALPLVEALICTYGGDEERQRLGIPSRRKTAAIDRVQKARMDLDMLAKSADAHIATSNAKSPHSAREYHIRAKAKQLGIWLDPSKRTTAADRRQNTQDGDLQGYRSDNWDADDTGLGALAFTAHSNGGRPMNAISINRLAGLGDASGRLVPEEVEARIANDHRPPIQVQVKIGDHEQNGCFRYKAWALHRDIVLQRLRWDVVEQQDDYVTFSVPAALAEASEVERKAKVPKEERRYWGDKTDFCRCLEVVINEVRGIKGRNTRPSTLGPEMLQAREQMILTTEYKTKLAKLRELQATVREGSATADRMRQEEEELAAKHAAEMERLNAKYGGSLRSVKRKRTASVMAAGGIGEKIRKKPKKLEMAKEMQGHPANQMGQRSPGHAPPPHMRMAQPQWGRPGAV